MDADAVRPLVVVMGVSGSGKTTVGEPLAERLGVDLGEADDFHPQANKDKMAAGTPLTDEDRIPWLHEIGAWLEKRRESGAVATCSALKRSYRDLLRDDAAGAVFLHLTAPHELLTERMATRKGHFMPPSLLQSQLDTLEPLEQDEDGLEIDSTLPPEEIVDRFLTWLEKEHA